MKYVIAWLILAVVIVLFLGIVNWPLFHLVTRGTWGRGKVIELLPHEAVRYEYHLGDETFQGQMRSEFPSPSRPAIGQSILICYDPKHPQTSVPGNPTEILVNVVIPEFLATIFIPTIILARFAYWMKRRKIMLGQRQALDHSNI